MSENILRDNGLKRTCARQAILDCVTSSESPISADEVYLSVSKSMRINLSTVYRTLSVLTHMGILIKMQKFDGKTSYERSGSIHHHRLVCSECHRSLLIDDCPLDKLSHHLGDKTGFVITGHSLEFVGICPDCAQNRDLKTRKEGHNG